MNLYPVKFFAEDERSGFNRGNKPQPSSFPAFKPPSRNTLYPAPCMPFLIWTISYELSTITYHRHPGAKAAFLIRIPFFVIIRHVVLQTGARKNADPISRLFTC
jgi:hypothetical protein